MLLKVYSIRDAKTEAYSNPFYAHNRQAAVRLFETACNDPAVEISKYPDDFALFEIGVFDDAAGLILSEIQPVRVIGANELKRPDEAIHSVDMLKLSNDFNTLRQAVSNAMLAMSKPAPVQVVEKKGWF